MMRTPIAPGRWGRIIALVRQGRAVVTMNDPKPILLAGRLVRLEPLEVRHAAELFAALAIDPDIWKWMPIEPPDTAAGMEALIAARLPEQARGEVVLVAQ